MVSSVPAGAATASAQGLAKATPGATPVASTDSTTRISSAVSVGPDANEAIAIIGLSGRYPQAPDLASFWEVLASGRDCIGEVPAERWPVQGWFEENVERAVASGRSYSRWGGFL